MAEEVAETGDARHAEEPQDRAEPVPSDARPVGEGGAAAPAPGPPAPAPPPAPTASPGAGPSASSGPSIAPGTSPLISPSGGLSASPSPSIAPGTSPAHAQPQPGSADPRPSAATSAEYVKGKTAPADSEGVADGGEAMDQAAETRRYAEQGYAHFSREVNNSGIGMFGDHGIAIQQQVTVKIGAEEIQVERTTVSRRDVRYLCETYVNVLGFGQICTALGHHQVIVLYGLEATGRRATAVNALHACGATAVELLSVDKSVPLRKIYDEQLFTAGTGYILNHSLALEPDTVEALEALVARCGAYLVIVTTGSAPTGRLDLAFAHHAPASADVLLSHLKYRLDFHECPACDEHTDKDAYAQQRVAEALRLDNYRFTVRMHEVVSLADVMAEHLHSEVATAVLVQRDRSKLRELAVRALKVAPDKPELTDQSARWQSFRVAYAVFDGFPMSDVFEAGELLRQEVLPLFETRGTTPDHVIFEGTVVDLLLSEMHQSERSGRPTAPVTVPRRARLVDSALTTMILDVAWNDLDAAHLPLLTWLDVLAGGARPRMRVRAAHAAGLLATFDFDEVYRTLIKPWAGRGFAYRLAAASALELAAVDERLTTRVKRQVNDWAKSPNPRVQDSAVRALSTQIGLADPATALDTFRRLAGRAELAESSSIAVGMATLFTDSGAEVLDELTEWAGQGNPHSRRHAVRVMLLLSKLVLPKKKMLLAEDETRLAMLAGLWRDALIGPDTAGRAWEPLRRWILAADGEPELEEFIVALAGRILCGARHDRALFHLRIWLSRHGGSAVLRRVYDAVLRS